MRVVSAVKGFSLRYKRLLTEAEFCDIVGATLPSNVGKSVQDAKTTV